MSLVFVVGSEDQLSTGTAWCNALAATARSQIHVVVVGTDRTTLAEYARRKTLDQLKSENETVKVEVVESDTAAVLAYARSVSCRKLLMVYRTGDSKFQRKLFEESMVATLWVRANQPPPTAADQVFAMFRHPTMVTSMATEQLFGFAPAAALCESIDLDTDDLAAKASSAMEDKAVTSGDLVVCGIENLNASDPIFKAGVTLLDQTTDVSVALVHTGHSLVETLASRVHLWAASIAPPMDRDQRIELAQDLQTGSKPNLEFLGLMSAAAMLASFGLLQDSAAVIIGAMLIAPLMTPILGAGLALTQGNRPLFQSALWTIALGFTGALLASIVFGWLFWLFQEPHVTGEMWARCRPSPLDFCVGMVGGIAASYARTRSHLSSALAGAAIAAALVPPIATAGLQIAFGHWGESQEGIPVVGPLLLVSVNVLTIMIGSSFVLWARGMRSDRTRTMSDRWTLRMFALLLTLTLLILIWELHPSL